MKVTVCGPNLPDQRKGDLHVHASACPDLNRGQYRRLPKHLVHTLDVGSMQEVVEFMFPPDDFEWDPADENEWSRYRDEFAWFPCIQGKLPGRLGPPVMQAAGALVKQPGFDLPATLIAFSEWYERESENLPPELTHDDVVERFLVVYTQDREA